MSSDHQYSHMNGTKFKGSHKMMVLEKEVAQELFSSNKAIVGGAGSTQELGQAWSWLSAPNPRLPRFKYSEFVALTKEGNIYTSADLNTWVHVDVDHYSIGTGSKFAIGAMAAGKSTKRAVEIATEHDPSTGFGVTEIKV